MKKKVFIISYEGSGYTFFYKVEAKTTSQAKLAAYGQFNEYMTTADKEEDSLEPQIKQEFINTCKVVATIKNVKLKDIQLPK